MEEIQENTNQEDQKRKVTIYSPELKLRLVEEYKSVADKISATQFAREHEISNSTFFGWIGKAGINSQLPQKKAVDVRSMIPIGGQNIGASMPSTILAGKSEPKPTMIPIVINGNEIMTTPEGIGIIASSMKTCSH